MFSRVSQFFRPVSCCMTTAAVVEPKGAITHQFEQLLLQLPDTAARRDYQLLSQLFMEIEKLASRKSEFYFIKTDSTAQCMVEGYIVLAELAAEYQMPLGALHILEKCRWIIEKCGKSSSDQKYQELTEIINQRTVEFNAMEAAIQKKLKRAWRENQSDFKKPSGSLSLTVSMARSNVERYRADGGLQPISEDGKLDSFPRVS